MYFFTKQNKDQDHQQTIKKFVLKGENLITIKRRITLHGKKISKILISALEFLNYLGGGIYFAENALAPSRT